MKKTILAIALIIGLNLVNNDALHVLIQVQESEGFTLISYYEKDGKNIAVFQNAYGLIRKF